jgi:hypothetical protein
VLHVALTAAVLVLACSSNARSDDSTPLAAVSFQLEDQAGQRIGSWRQGEPFWVVAEITRPLEDDYPVTLAMRGLAFKSGGVIPAGERMVRLGPFVVRNGQAGAAGGVPVAVPADEIACAQCGDKPGGCEKCRKPCAKCGDRKGGCDACNSTRRECDRCQGKGDRCDQCDGKGACGDCKGREGGCASCGKSGSCKKCGGKGCGCEPSGKPACPKCDGKSGGCEACSFGSGVCGKCKGAGSPCKACKGSGTCDACKGKGGDCPACRGSGKCGPCDGKGGSCGVCGAPTGGGSGGGGPGGGGPGGGGPGGGGAGGGGAGGGGAGGGGAGGGGAGGGAGKPKPGDFMIYLVNDQRLHEPGDVITAQVREAIKDRKPYNQGAIVINADGTDTLLNEDSEPPEAAKAFKPFTASRQDLESQVERVVETIVRARRDSANPDIRTVVVWPERELVSATNLHVFNSLASEGCGAVSFLCPDADPERARALGEAMKDKVSDGQVTARSPKSDELVEHIDDVLDAIGARPDARLNLGQGMK